MLDSKYIIVLLFSIGCLACGLSQEISIHPVPKIDSVWYSDVTEESKPKPMSCQENSIGYFRLKYTSEIIIDDFKKDTVKTDKEDWVEEDEKDFDSKYNEENKEELDALDEDFIEADVSIDSQAKEEIDRYIDVNWNGYTYNICKPDCKSSIQQCYIYQEITHLKEYTKTYKYRTSYSWLEEKEDGENEVEIDFDLVIAYEVLIYFYVTCSCDDIPDLLSATPTKLLNENNPWVHIDLTSEKMKPGYPFVSSSKPFPFLPVLGGAIGTGALIYIATKDEDPASCGSISQFNVNDSTCGLENGNISIEVTPPSNYTYSWSTGQTSLSLENQSAGLYTVTVTKPETNCLISQTFVIRDKNLELESTAVVTSEAACGESNATANIVNPQADVTYAWSDGSTGSTISGLAAGPYSVTATLGSTCEKIIEFNVPEKSGDFTIIPAIKRPTCGKEDGNIKLSITPQSEYTYQWSTGESSSEISSLPAGEYIATVTNLATSCSNSITLTIEDLPADFTLTFTTVEASCGNSDGSSSVLVQPEDAYSYQWSTGENTNSLIESPAGDYQITVTLIDSDCSVTGSVTINESALPVTFNFNNSDANCGLQDGEISVEIEPQGMYSYIWSNGQEVQNLTAVSAGEYTVTITDENGCTASASTSVEDVPIIYIEDIESIPGDCINGGDISITLATPGEGPIVLSIDGPNGQDMVSLSAGTHNLSTFLSIPPGNYSIEVYDQTAGQSCNHETNIVVEDTTPEIMAIDDGYEVESGETIVGNVLDNDEGLTIMVQSFFDLFGGTATVSSDGTFQFSPDGDFQGEASFNYIIEDGCGNLDTAFVSIEVKSDDCDFLVEFEIIAAHCGLEDGHAFAFVEPSGNYSYQWSDGTTGSELGFVSSGTYGLTVTNTDLSCELIVEVIIPEKGVSYVSNVIVFESSCSASGEIHFQLGNTPGPFLVTVSHPNGIEAFVVPAGTVLLSDYIPIFPGDYTISVYDSNAGPECTETFSVIVEESIGLIIAVLEIIPPSSPTASDGAVVIEITNPSTGPYTIWVNEEQWDITTELEFIISELGVGEYSIFITDIFGCTSNVVFIFVPPPTPQPLNFGFGQNPNLIATKENRTVSSFVQPAFFVELAKEVHFFGLHTTSSYQYIRAFNNNQHVVSTLFDLTHFQLGNKNFTIQSGGIWSSSFKDNMDVFGIIQLKGDLRRLGRLRGEITVQYIRLNQNPFSLGFKVHY
ncbi:MAG: cadherin-like domain-containing protein [Saprospiraceae bacterium]|nr:cadherin-like domain-containing protein [Saprospiraceae bacterium]